MAAWLSLDEAIQQASSHLVPISQTQVIDLFSAKGRVLAQPIHSPIDVPPWDNSAMDGYAIKLGDAKGIDGTLTVSQTIKAGELSTQALTADSCARIMTGAPIPPGTDTVVMQENVERSGDKIHIVAPIKKGQNIRKQAGDIATNECVLPAGQILSAQDLMLLSSIGINKVCVFQQPKVAIIATGDELASHDEKCNDKQIFESHRAGLNAKLEALGCIVTDAGIVKDDQALITQTFSELAAQHHLVISSGGVSVGDADWVKPALSALGQLHLWKLAIKPGKPFAFGQFGTCYFCGLPGNPVSAFVTFEQIVTPLILRLKGVKQGFSRLTIKAKLENDFRRRAGRLEFARGRYQQDSEGNFVVTMLPKQSSSVMTSVTQANCYIVIPAQCEQLQADDVVDIQPFSIFN